MIGSGITEGWQTGSRASAGGADTVSSTQELTHIPSGNTITVGERLAAELEAQAAQNNAPITTEDFAADVAARKAALNRMGWHRQVN